MCPIENKGNAKNSKKKLLYIYNIYIEYVHIVSNKRNTKAVEENKGNTNIYQKVYIHNFQRVSNKEKRKEMERKDRVK